MTLTWYTVPMAPPLVVVMILLVRAVWRSSGANCRRLAVLARASCPCLSTLEVVCLPELSSSKEMLPIHRTADTRRNISSCSLSDSPTCKQTNKQVNNMIHKVFVHSLFVCLLSYMLHRLYETLKICCVINPS